MAFQIREGEGSLFVNDRKEKPSQPDYQGSMRVGGQLYRVAGWRREAQSGKRWLSLSIKPDERETADGPAKERAAKASGGSHEFNDPLTF